MSEASTNPGLAAIATPPAGGDTPRLASMRRAAQEFEPLFLAEVPGTITQGLGGDDLLGDEGDVFCEMLAEDVAKLISRSGGIGVADAAPCALPKAQEVA